MFPLDLQIHMNGLVCAFWTLMCLQIGKRTNRTRCIRPFSSNRSA